MILSRLGVLVSDIDLVLPCHKITFKKKFWQSDVFKDKSTCFNVRGTGKKLLSLLGRSELSGKKSDVINFLIPLQD